MSWKRKISGGTLAFVGFMLSPLSWWNDLFVNIPLALAFAWIVSLFWPSVYLASFILGYWITNLLGFVLLQKGAQQMTTEKPVPYTRWSFLRDVLTSPVSYTHLTLPTNREV